MKKSKILFSVLFSFQFLYASNLVLPLLYKDHIYKVAGYDTTPPQYKIKIVTKTKFKYIPTMTPVVYFKFNSASLSLKGKKLLDEVVKKYKNKNVIFVINGYADKPGSTKYNLQLSETRAQNVKNFLISKGVSPKRIIVKFYGNKNLLVNTPNPDKINRRVVVQIIPAPKG